MARHDRDAGGRFARGNAGGPGRPPRTVEDTYLVTMADGVSVDDWAEIVSRAVEDAKGGDATARAWLSKHLLPPAPSPQMPWPLRGARTDHDPMALLMHTMGRTPLDGDGEA